MIMIMIIIIIITAVYCVASCNCAECFGFVVHYCHLRPRCITHVGEWQSTKVSAVINVSSTTLVSKHLMKCP